MADTDRKGRVLVNVRIPKSLADRLNEEADRRVVGRDLLIEAAVKDFLKDLPPLDPILERGDG